jgi:hypothetical protein
MENITKNVLEKQIEELKKENLKQSKIIIWFALFIIITSTVYLIDLIF